VGPVLRQAAVRPFDTVRCKVAFPRHAKLRQEDRSKHDERPGQIRFQLLTLAMAPGGGHGRGPPGCIIPGGQATGGGGVARRTHALGLPVIGRFGARAKVAVLHLLASRARSPARYRGTYQTGAYAARGHSPHLFGRKNQAGAVQGASGPQLALGPLPARRSDCGLGGAVRECAPARAPG
jgi:hypothetical protein